MGTWLEGSVEQAITQQRPLPNELLRIVTKVEKIAHAPVETLRYQSPASDSSSRADLSRGRHHF